MSPVLESELGAHVAAGKWARAWINGAVDAGRIKHPKQAWRTLEKWAAKGLYDYAAPLDLG